MKRSSAAFATLAILTMAGAGWRVRSSADDRVQPIPDTASTQVPAVVAPLMMQTKLTTTQRILEGVLNRDFDRIQTSAKTLGQIAELAADHQGFDEDRVYEHFRAEFIRLCGQLESMAAAENLEGSAYIHQNLTATCIACHTHVRDESPD